MQGGKHVSLFLSLGLKDPAQREIAFAMGFDGRKPSELLLTIRIHK